MDHRSKRSRTARDPVLQLNRAESGEAASFTAIRSASYGVAIVCLCYAVVFGQIRDLGSASMLVAVAALAMSGPIWIERSRYDIARSIPIVPTSAMLLVLIHRHGTSSGLQLLYFPLACLPALLYPMRERRHLLLTVSTIAACFLTSLGARGAPASPLHTEMPEFAAHVPLLAFFATAMAMFGMVQELHRREALLERSFGSRREVEEEVRWQKGVVAAASRARGDFVTAVSHEIRTPLNGIMGMTDILASTRLTRGQRGLVRLIQASGESLRVIVNDVVQLNALNSGTVEIVPAPFMLGHAVETAAEAFVEGAADKRLVLLIEVEFDGDVEVIGDAARLRQVLGHLLSNAIKFTEHGKVSVRARIDVHNDRARVEILVEDTGLGIDEVEVERIFDPFEQVNRDADARPSGTGLGLALCKRILDLMGGTLDLQNRVGAGATFIVRLEMPITGARRAEHDLGGARLAVISHRPERLAALSRTLAHMRAHVGASSQPADLAGERWDLVLVDAGPSRKHAPDRVAHLIGVPRDHVVEVRDSRRDADQPGVLFPSARDDLGDELRHLLSSIHPRQARELGPPSGPRFTGLHVLVVEDDLTSQLVARGFLGSLGVTCDVANDGQEACEQFDPARHAAVFMDVHMPVMTGLEATAWIRANRSPAGETPIIATTAHHAPDDGATMRSRGFSEYVYKPLRTDGLAAVLRRYFPNHEVTPERPTPQAESARQGPTSA